MSRRFILWGAVFLGVTALFAADLFQMPKFSPDVRRNFTIRNVMHAIAGTENLQVRRCGRM